MSKKECGHKEWNPCGNDFYSCRECGILRTSQQVNLYAEKDGQIADLEAKLAEKDQELNDICQNYDFQINDFSREIHRLQEREKVLEQQLAEKDSELDKWSTVYARAYVNRQNALIAEKVELKEQLAEKEKEIENIRSTHIYRFYLDKDKVQDVYITDLMLKVFNQDKISFCIEKLEKVKAELEFTSNNNEWITARDDRILNGVCDFINNQIKELKDGE